MAKKNKRPIYEMQIDMLDADNGIQAISLVSSPAIQEGWVALSEQHKVELKVIDSVKQVVTGPVLIPGQLILRIDESTGEEYDIMFPAETVAKAAELYMRRQQNLNATIEHKVSTQQVEFYESWISVDSKKDKSAVLLGKEYPVGTWFVSAKITDSELFSEAVMTGKLTGFSLEGLFSEKLIKASAANIDVEASNFDPNESKLQELTIILEEYLSSLK
jgi:hypothetical protein